MIRELFKGVKPDCIPELTEQLEVLNTQNPGAVITEPGLHECIDGKLYWNDIFIIAK